MNYATETRGLSRSSSHTHSHAKELPVDCTSSSLKPFVYALRFIFTVLLDYLPNRAAQLPTPVRPFTSPNMERIRVSKAGGAL